MVSTKMQQRRDTAANWASTNPVLAQGEVGIDLTALAASTPAIKVGDGSTAWASLPFASGAGSGGSGSTTPTASTLAKWDANANMSAGAFLPLETSTASSSTPIVLTIGSTQIQTITGTTQAQTIQLPTTGVKSGHFYIISNQMPSAAVTVKASDGTTVAVQTQQTIGVYRAWIDTPTSNPQWVADIKAIGTVLSVRTGALVITTNGTAATYSLPSTSAPASATLAMWDSGGNMAANAFLPLQTSTAASATPIALTLFSTQVQVITGTTTAQTIALPVIAVTPGYECVIVNQMTTASVTVQASGGATIATLAPGEMGVFKAAVASPTLSTDWSSVVRVPGIVFRAKTGAIVITTAGTQVTYTLPAASSTLLGSGDNAASATKLATARNINGVAFDGTADITVTDSTAEKTANKNTANGYAGLDSGGKVAAAQLPAYVDDVLEFANLAAFPGTGSAGIIYVTDDTNKTYRWSGSAYIEISPSPGSTDSVTEGSVNLYYTNARADARVAAATDAATSKSTPVDADELPLADSAASFGLKKLTWANLKATVKTYYDSVTSTLTNKDLTSGTNTFPTLNQSTTGTAAGLSSTLAIASGGTNATTAAAGLANLAAAGIPNTLLPNGIINFNSAAQAQLTVAATNYYVTNSQLALPATYLQGMTAPSGSGGTVKCGTAFRWRVVLTKNGNGTGSFTFLIYRGVNGTTADTIDVSQIIGAAMSAAADTLILDVQLAVVTTGATGSYFWSITAVHSDASTLGFGLGAATGAPTTFTGTVSSVAMNTASLVFGLGFVCGAGGTMPTLSVPVVQAQAFNID